jgi:hypothetical protein
MISPGHPHLRVGSRREFARLPRLACHLEPGLTNSAFAGHLVAPIKTSDTAGSGTPMRVQAERRRLKPDRTQDRPRSDFCSPAVRSHGPKTAIDGSAKRRSDKTAPVLRGIDPTRERARGRSEFRSPGARTLGSRVTNETNRRSDGAASVPSEIGRTCAQARARSDFRLPAIRSLGPEIVNETNRRSDGTVSAPREIDPTRERARARRPESRVRDREVLRSAFPISVLLSFPIPIRIPTSGAPRP